MEEIMKTICYLRRLVIVAVMALFCLNMQANVHRPHHKRPVVVVKKCGCKCRKHHRHHHKIKRIVVPRKCR